MGICFWIRRFAWVFALAFIAIAGSHLLRSRPLEHALTEGAVWAAISAGIYTATSFYRWRRCQRCEQQRARTDAPGLDADGAG